MKKILNLILAVVMCLTFVACGGESEPETVELTKENIGEYIEIRGEYKNGDYHSGILYYTSTADLDIQAYSIVSGTFDNVKITVKANLKDKGEDIMGKWHLADTDGDSVTITFSMPSSGTYSSSYSIECIRNTRKLSGTSNLEIIDVSGTYTPSK